MPVLIKAIIPILDYFSRNTLCNMPRIPHLFICFLLLNVTLLIGQSTEEIVDQIKKEAIENSRLEQLAHELMDVIGPRLVGTP